MRSANTIADSKVAVYARPSTFRIRPMIIGMKNSLMHFPIHPFGNSLSDKEDFIYRTDFSLGLYRKIIGLS